LIAEPCIGTKTLPASMRAVDCIHPKKDEAKYGEIRPAFHRSGGVYRLRRLCSGLPGLSHFPPATTCPKNGRVLLTRTPPLRPLGLISRRAHGSCSSPGRRDWSAGLRLVRNSASHDRSSGRSRCSPHLADPRSRPTRSLFTRDYGKIKGVAKSAAGRGGASAARSSR